MEARFGVGNDGGDGGRELNVKYGSVIGGNSCGAVFQQEVLCVTHGRGGDGDLVVGGEVHEHVVLTVLVKVLHVGLVDDRHFDFHTGVEGFVDEFA